MIVSAAPLDGVLVVDKPEGPTSHDVVAVARRAFGVRGIGHTGTLDPMATGVLVLVIGRATRLAQFLAGDEKSYDATIRLGVATDTWDRTGLPAGPPSPGLALPSQPEIEACLRGFVGAHDQLPPRFSAKTVDGVRAHELARRGQQVDVRPAKVVLHALDVLAVASPLVHVRMRCSPGYYVRALAHDLGRRLGCGACLDALRRTASGAFGLDDATPLGLIALDPAEAARRVIPLERLLPDLPAVRLVDDEARRARHGNEIRPAGLADVAAPEEAEAFRLLAPDGTLLAVARPGRTPGVLHPAVVLK